jgi:hypothetical protein
MSWLRDDLVTQRPDLVVVAGDIYHQRATPTEERYMQEWLRGVISRCRCNVILVRGNHDDPDQLDVLAATSTIGGRVLSHLRPFIGPILTSPIRLSALPWPDLGHLAAAMGSGVSIADRREAAHAALIDILRGFRSDDGMPHLLVAHANISGATVATGQPLAGGDELTLTVGDLMESGAGAVALGHIHAAQALVASVPVLYCGSLFRTTFGEAEGRKGYSIFGWDGKAWTVEDRDGPARRMLLLDVDLGTDMSEDGGGASLVYLNAEQSGRGEALADVAGAEIRLRAHFAPEHRECMMALADAEKSALLRRGAHSVVVDPQPLMVQRTRCAEISSARTTGEKVAAWARTAGLEVPEGTVEKLAALETEVGP